MVPEVGMELFSPVHATGIGTDHNQLLFVFPAIGQKVSESSECSLVIIKLDAMSVTLSLQSVQINSDDPVCTAVLEELSHVS